MIKKAICSLLLAAVCILSFAQMPRIPQRLALVEIDSEIAGTMEHLEVFNMPENGVNQYFLALGHLGFGDEIVQVLFDPVSELFIPLGGTVAEALETMQSMQDLFKGDPDDSIELPGCLNIAFPNKERETVKITYMKPLLSRILRFSVQREGYIRATHIQRTDFNSLVNGVKLYGKLHPKE